MVDAAAVEAGIYAGYADDYQVYKQCTDEPFALAAALFETVPVFERALDIGPGDGRLTLEVSRRCRELHFCEPQEALYARTSQLLERAGVAASGSMQAFPCGVPHGAYDLALASHMLYFIERPDWSSFFAAIAECLASSGRVAVILQEARSELRQALAESDRWCVAEDLLQSDSLLSELGLQLEARRSVTPRIKASSVAEARAIGRIMFGREMPERASLRGERLFERLLHQGLDNHQSILVYRRHSN
jgi:predicted TPR repeat methyltransferase